MNITHSYKQTKIYPKPFKVDVWDTHITHTCPTLLGTLGQISGNLAIRARDSKPHLCVLQCVEV